MRDETSKSTVLCHIPYPTSARRLLLVCRYGHSSRPKRPRGGGGGRWTRASRPAYHSCIMYVGRRIGSVYLFTCLPAYLLPTCLFVYFVFPMSSRSTTTHSHALHPDVNTDGVLGMDFIVILNNIYFALLCPPQPSLLPVPKTFGITPHSTTSTVHAILLQPAFLHPALERPKRTP